MAREFDADFTEYNNALLATEFDTVSPDFSDGSIVQATNSGRGGKGGVTFTPCTDANGGNYALQIGKQLTAQSERTVQMAVVQNNPQGTLGGRLLTLYDAPDDVFGATVQVAINMMSDNKLKAWRSTAANTGLILRNTDQGGDSQMTLLGTSDVTDGDAGFEIEVVHHITDGSITVWQENVLFWTLTGINTAVSGLNQSTGFLIGGYAVQSVGSDTLHHEDLDAVISWLTVINGSTNPDDPNDPTQRIGLHKPLLSTPSGVGNYSQFTADPAVPNWSNVDEIPPDGASEVFAATTDLKDSYAMTNVAGTDSNQVYLTHRAYVKTDTPAECGVSDAAANFEAFVYMTQPEAGTCITSDNDTSACALTDLVTRRAQSVCTIAHDGEKVKFKPNLVNQDGMWVFLTPLDAPPRVLNASGPTRLGSAIFNLTSGPIVNYSGGEVRYTAPYSGVPFSPPAYAVDTQDKLDSTGDYTSFLIDTVGVGLDVVLIDNAQANVFNPYTSPLTGFHFREDIIGSPFFWIGPSAAYNGETTYSYAVGDIFKMTRNGSDVQLRQNATLRETVTVVYPTHTNVATFMGAWGWDPLIPGYTIQPAILNCIVRIGGTDCVQGNYLQLSCTAVGTYTEGELPENNEWGIAFAAGDGVTGDATVVDKNGPNSPNTPVFGYNTDTQIEFSLVGGNVVLTVTDWVTYADNMTTVVANVATWNYTVAYANTDDFALHTPASGYPVGLPTFPAPSLEYDFVDAVANQPLRLGVVCSGDSAGSLPNHAGVKDVSFTFNATSNPSQYAGLMRESGADRVGTVTEAPSSIFGYRQSFQNSTPASTPITLADANASEDGPTDPAPVV